MASSPPRPPRWAEPRAQLLHGDEWQAKRKISEVTVGADGRLHAAALRAAAEPDTLAALRERRRQMMPRVDLGALVMEVMGRHPGFVAAYAHSGGGGPGWITCRRPGRRC